MPLHSDPALDIESRRMPGAPGGRSAYAVIRCRNCPTTDEASIHDKSAGWARRVFKSRGWTVAERAGRHLCPTCARGPRGLGGLSAREAAKNGSSLDRSGVMAPPASVVVDPDILLPERLAEALSHLGHVALIHKETTPAVTPTPTPAAEPRHAYKASPKKGLGQLPLSPRPPGLPDKLTPAVARPGFHRSARKTHGYRYPGDAAVIARLYCRACGIDDPTINRDYVVWAEDGLVGWAPISVAQPPVTSVTSVTPPSPEPAPILEEPMSLTPIPPPRPTRENIRTIQEALDVHYDVEAQRYRGVNTDDVLAAKLDVPRAWVTEERDRAYGPAANEAHDLALDKWRRDLTNRAAKLGEDIMAQAERLMTLATDAETLKARLSEGPKP